MRVSIKLYLNTNKQVRDWIWHGPSFNNLCSKEKEAEVGRRKGTCPRSPSFWEKNQPSVHICRAPPASSFLPHCLPTQPQGLILSSINLPQSFKPYLFWLREAYCAWDGLLLLTILSPEHKNKSICLNKLIIIVKYLMCSVSSLIFRLQSENHPCPSHTQTFHSAFAFLYSFLFPI